MTKQRLSAALAMTAAALMVASCGQLGALGDALKPYTPKVSFDKLDLTALDFTKIDVDFVFKIDNPNPLNVKLDTFSYALGLGGNQLLSGTNDQGVKLKAKGSSELRLPVSLTFKNIFDTVSGLSGKDEIPFEISGDFGWNTPVGVAKVPFKETGNFPVVRAPDVSVEGVRVGKLDILSQRATVNVDIGMANPDGGSALQFSGLDYHLNFGKNKVANGVMDALPAVPGGGRSTVTLPVNLNLLDIGGAIVSAITGKGNLDIDFGGTVNVGTPFGVIPLSIDQNGNFKVN